MASLLQVCEPAGRTERLPAIASVIVSRTRNADWTPSRSSVGRDSHDPVSSTTLSIALVLAVMPQNGETAPLLGENIPNLARTGNLNRETAVQRIRRAANVRAVVYAVLTTIFVVALVLVLFFWEKLTGVVGHLPKDPHKAARYILNNAPVIVSLTLDLRGLVER